MNLVVNRVKYKIIDQDNYCIVFSKENIHPFRMNFEYFKNRFDADIEFNDLSDLKNESPIYYSFENKGTNQSKDFLPYNYKFEYNFLIWKLGNHFLSKNYFVEYKPTGFALSCFMLNKSFNDEWDQYQRWDFEFERHRNELIYNLGSKETFISKYNDEKFEESQNPFVVDKNGLVIKKSKLNTEDEYRVLANQDVKIKFNLGNNKEPINFHKRYSSLLKFYNEVLKSSSNLIFESVGLETKSAKKVNFNNNRMLFGNNQTDINPISGMRSHGVYRPIENATDIQFIFIFENTDDANSLYKYLKNGFKGFPGLESYVNIPVTLANSIVEGKYKKLQFSSKENIIKEFFVFSKTELKEEIYQNLFAFVIGDFDKNDPDDIYYKLKLELIKKGIPSQFINYRNIRKSSVFNYHLPNIAIGTLAKLGGIPWRLDTPQKNDLVIGFNQIKSNNQKFIGSTVFFDNQGRLKKTYSFNEKDSTSEIISLLRNAIVEYLKEDDSLQRLVIHYHKSLSNKEHGAVDNLLRNELKISIPYSVVEINDTKSRLDIGFDPNNNYSMPISGSFIQLSKKEYLLFNNNRFAEKSPVNIKDELPLKLKIHFADESGFSHFELIEQVYQFSRLIWKGLKQRSQPATCYYAKEIAKFKSKVDEPIPINYLTQSTPWTI